MWVFYLHGSNEQSMNFKKEVIIRNPAWHILTFTTGNKQHITASLLTLSVDMIESLVDQTHNESYLGLPPNKVGNEQKNYKKSKL